MDGTQPMHIWAALIGLSSFIWKKKKKRRKKKEEDEMKLGGRHLGGEGILEKMEDGYDDISSCM